MTEPVVPRDELKGDALMFWLGVVVGILVWNLGMWLGKVSR